MTSELFQTIQSKYSTSIFPKEICSSISDILTQKIKNEIEGKCISDGYVKTDSVKIISRSSGSILASHFNGSMLYHINFVADICNPFEGMVIVAKVKNINKMGILAVSGEGDFLNILLAKQHHIDNEEFNKVEIGDDIYVNVIGKRFEFGDTQISIIGKLIDKPIAQKKKKSFKKEPVVKALTEEKQPEQEVIEFNNKDRKYKWLGTFNLGKKFKFQGREYVTIEHAINAQKNQDPDFQDLFTKGADSYIGDIASVAKKTGNKTNMKKMKKKMIPNWEKESLRYMKEILIEYYQANPDLKKKLMETGDSELIYRGPGADSFWGMKQGIEEGSNHYGKILMELRGELK